MDVHEAIMSGRSIHRFLPTPVPMDSLRRIIEGAGMAPSGHNIQPWKLYVVGGVTKTVISAGILVAIATGDPKGYAPKLVRARCRVARPRHLYGLWRYGGAGKRVSCFKTTNRRLHGLPGRGIGFPTGRGASSVPIASTSGPGLRSPGIVQCACADHRDRRHWRFSCRRNTGHRRRERYKRFSTN